MKRLSFINKGMAVLASVLLLIFIMAFSYLAFALWAELPMMFKIFFPIAFVIIFAGIIVLPLNGMMITKKGNVIFLPDFRLKKFKTEDLKRIAFNFNEWENKKYSVTVKLISKNGDVFMKNYSKQFRNLQNKKLAMTIYTINKKKVDGIVKKLADIDICVITIIDQSQEIIYQNL